VTPLARKLGIRPGDLVALLAAPCGFDATLGALPEGATIRDSLDGDVPFDVVLCFTTRRAELVEALRTARPALAPAGGLWIAWPKRASGLPTEVTDDLVRELALPTGLVDNKVCAVDATWTGLRLVVRRELRPAAHPGRGSGAR
jgi:hypothetical protein